jgi:alpha-tubulin suppressor-like RCC1 family protein
MLSLARVRRLVVVAAGALVVASVGSSVPVLALSDGSQSPEIAVEQAEIGTGNSFGVEGPVVAGVSGNFASVLAPQTASVSDPSNTFGTGVTPQITAGDFHTCALLNTGAVNCWGYNLSGQLGNGTTTTSSAPVAVDTFTDGATAVSITAGSYHTCALLNTGAVNCWGDNSNGQLGNGNTTSSSAPVAVDTFTDGATAVSITAGSSHTCALLNTGAVNCWGWNFDGQLGNGNTANSSAPVAVRPFTDGVTAVSITAGAYHTCAVLNTGAVNCWGYNFSGQLGNGTTANSSAPDAVDTFTGGVTAVSITAGYYDTCALLNTGAVNCWGNNGNGQLGNGNTANSSAPVAVNAFTDVTGTAVSITAGGTHTCALLNTGAVNCWGNNSVGQLGNNSTADSLVPVGVDPFTVGSASAVSIAAGVDHTCAVLNTGAVNCWGNNSDGQLGNGNTNNSSAPVAVNAFTDVTGTAVSITAGNLHTCAVLNTGAVNCWGDNSYGQLGNGNTTSSSAPVAVNAFTDGATAVSITAGAFHTCAVLNTGAVNCWGYNSFGGLGNNTTNNSSAPVAVNAFTGGATAVSITAGGFHTCAVLNTGAVNCWGNNGFGRLGNGNTTSSSVPVAVAAFTDVTGTAVSITAGFFHTCAVLNTGAVNCWGYNSDGQLGNGNNTDSSAPVAVATFTDVTGTAVSITAGDSHTCALLNTGAVNCWGYNSDGQLGNNTTNNSSAPVAVDTFTDGATAVSITAGDYHTCALLNTGAVNCWGYNSDGQLGNNTANSSAPVAVAAFTDGATAVSITAAYRHTCALLNTGAVNCWGDNGFGQLGNGTNTDSSVPAKVMLFLPGVPTGVSGVAGDSEVVVSWTAPVSDGGLAISSYKVTSSPHNKTCTTTGALTCTVAGLTNATAYTFTVTATNAAGDSPASTASGAATPVTAPGVPTAVSATAGNGQATVVWTAPVSDGGSEISSYTVTSSPHNKTCTTTGALTCTVAGLTNATAYTFTVTATNAAGDSPASTASGAVTPVASLVALTPGRLLETRSGPDYLTVDSFFQGNGRRDAGTTLKLTVTDRGGRTQQCGCGDVERDRSITERCGILNSVPMRN